MTRAEYKQALEAWRHVRGEGILDHVAATLADEIIDYEWRHGLRYLVWRISLDGVLICETRDRRAARSHLFYKRARITRAVRKPKWSP